MKVRNVRTRDVCDIFMALFFPPYSTPPHIHKFVLTIMTSSDAIQSLASKVITEFLRSIHFDHDFCPKVTSLVYDSSF